MSKKKKTTLGRVIERIFSAKSRDVDNEVSNFYNSKGDIVDIPFQEECVEKIVTDTHEIPSEQMQPPTLWKDEIEETCLQIARYAMSEKKLQNIVIDLACGVQKYDGLSFLLGDTVLKIVDYCSRSAFYLYLRKGKRIDCKIFIGGDFEYAFLTIKDDKEDITFVRLVEVHLLSVGVCYDLTKQIGLLTRYNDDWYEHRIYASLIHSYALSPIESVMNKQEFCAKFAEDENKRRTEGEDKQAETAVNPWIYLKGLPFTEIIQYHGEGPSILLK